MLDINREKCLNCAGCISLCPESALSMELDGVRIDRDACTLCELCVRFCPVLALEIGEEKTSVKS